MRLQGLVDGFIRPAIRTVLDGKHWKWRATLFVLALSLFRAFPSYDGLFTGYDLGTWQRALVQVDHPFTDMGRLFPDWANQHEAMLTFRITVPLAAHLLGLRRAGILIFQGLAGVVFLYASLALACKITASRKAALSVALAAACCWAGESGFHELRGGYFDIFAICLLVLALLAESPLLTAVCMLLAAFTDERAVLASPLVFLFAVTRSSRVGWRTLFGGKAIAVPLAIAAYGAARLYFTLKYSLAVMTGGNGLSVLSHQLNLVPLGLLTGLNGAWLLVGCGVAVLWLGRRYALAVSLLAAVALSAGSGLLVRDISRSVAYCFPAVFVALSVLSRHQSAEEVEKIAVWAGVISLLVPEYQIYGSSTPFWLPPFLFQIFRWIFFPRLVFP